MAGSLVSGRAMEMAALRRAITRFYATSIHGPARLKFLSAPNYPPILALNDALSTAKLFVHAAAYTIDRHFLTIFHDVAARIPARLLLGKSAWAESEVSCLRPREHSILSGREFIRSSSSSTD